MSKCHRCTFRISFVTVYLCVLQCMIFFCLYSMLWFTKVMAYTGSDQFVFARSEVVRCWPCSGNRLKKRPSAAAHRVEQADLSLVVVDLTQLPLSSSADTCRVFLSTHLTGRTASWSSTKVTSSPPSTSAASRRPSRRLLMFLLLVCCHVTPKMAFGISWWHYRTD